MKGISYAAVKEGLKDLKWEKVYTKNKGCVRSSAWYTRNGCSCSYQYSKKDWTANDFTPWMDTLCKETAQFFKLDHIPNAINFNFYRDGSQGIPWHSDDESLFRTSTSANATIISFSFGDSRQFEVKDKYEPDTKSIKMNLSDGDVVLMKGRLQQHYVHRVPEVAWSDMQEEEGRYNITLRTILTPSKKCALCNGSNSN